MHSGISKNNVQTLGRPQKFSQKITKKEHFTVTYKAFWLKIDSLEFRLDATLLRCLDRNFHLRYYYIRHHYYHHHHCYNQVALHQAVKR